MGHPGGQAQAAQAADQEEAQAPDRHPALHRAAVGAGAGAGAGDRSPPARQLQAGPSLSHPRRLVPEEPDQREHAQRRAQAHGLRGPTHGAWHPGNDLDGAERTRVPEEMGGRPALACRPGQDQRDLQPCRIRRAASRHDAGLGRSPGPVRAESGRGCQPASDHHASGPADHRRPGGRAAAGGRPHRAATDRDRAGARPTRSAGIGAAVVGRAHARVRTAAPVGGAARTPASAGDLRGAAQPLGGGLREARGQVAPLDHLRDPGRQPAVDPHGASRAARAGLAARSAQAQAGPVRPEATATKHRHLGHLPRTPALVRGSRDTAGHRSRQSNEPAPCRAAGGRTVHAGERASRDDRVP